MDSPCVKLQARENPALNFPEVADASGKIFGYISCLEPPVRSTVFCVESYMGTVGEKDGVKLEQQVLATGDGCERLSTFPYEAALME